MSRVLILGAGGHAQVVADILLRARDAGQPVVPMGYLDDDQSLHRGEGIDLAKLLVYNATWQRKSADRPGG
jgi:FlaA1/EpsC-like NDP-sugar epimerase